MNLVTIPTESLRQVSGPVTDFKNLIQLVQDMREVMKREKGLGIAAPQVGENIRLFILDSDLNLDNNRRIPDIYVNPSIMYIDGPKTTQLEGCLSIPGKAFSVERYNQVILSACDLNGEQFTLNAGGLLSRVFQHEIDHLHGHLIDYTGREVRL